MKKVFLFFVVAMAFASCTPKKAEEAPKADSTVVAAADSTATDSTAVAADSTAVAK